MIYNFLIFATALNSIFARELFHTISEYRVTLKYANEGGTHEFALNIKEFEERSGVLSEKTFYLSPAYITADWRNADDFCRQHGMKFAAIRTENEQDELFRYLERNRIYFDYAWTSLRDMNDDNRWTWSEQPTDKLNYIPNWNRGSREPDMGKNHTCGHINYDTIEKFTWGDYSCEKKYNFLCELNAEREHDESCESSNKITKLTFC